mmetsp:Transcript_22680/g.69737  ORF Transcript_22680/g.69737 Transcript_22680/m.69737 type:complete len:344 (+) Transcript_22680:96-1127(+)
MWVTLPFEEAFHPHDALSSPLRLSTAHFAANLHVPLVTAALYIAGIVYGHHLMRDKQPYSLKTALTAWNFFLALFSLVGAVKTAPLLVDTLTRKGFEASLCTPAATSYGAGPSGLWVQLFVVSKFFELLDTLFIVLRKRKMLFLHWYHHSTVLLYCFHAYAVEAPHALYFVAMNYSVHAIMYFYYGLMALGSKPKWFPPEVITTAQIAQMVVGVWVQVAAVHHKNRCAFHGWNLVFGGVMYLSYLALFVKFAFDRYVFRKLPRGKGVTLVAGYDRGASVRTAFPTFFRLVDCVDFLLRKYKQLQQQRRRQKMSGASSSASSVSSSSVGGSSNSLSLSGGGPSV